MGASNSSFANQSGGNRGSRESINYNPQFGGGYNSSKDQEIRLAIENLIGRSRTRTESETINMTGGFSDTLTMSSIAPLLQNGGGRGNKLSVRPTRSRYQNYPIRDIMSGGAELSDGCGCAATGINDPFSATSSIAVDGFCGSHEPSETSTQGANLQMHGGNDIYSETSPDYMSAQGANLQMRGGNDIYSATSSDYEPLTSDLEGVVVPPKPEEERKKEKKTKPMTTDEDDDDEDEDEDEEEDDDDDDEDDEDEDDDDDDDTSDTKGDMKGGGLSDYRSDSEKVLNRKYLYSENYVGYGTDSGTERYRRYRNRA